MRRLRSASQDNVRIGWPLKPTDYPKGYGVADPPGFCLKTCDPVDPMMYGLLENVTQKSQNCFERDFFK